MCDITNIQISGENRDANGVPTQYFLSFRLQGCEAVDIEIRSSQTGQVIYQGTAIQPAGAADANGYRLVTQTISPSESQRKPCNDTYYVTISCRHLPTCRHEGLVSISCKVDMPPPPAACSTTTVLAVRNSQGAEVNLGNPCLPPDTYTIEVISPWSPGSVAQWSVLPAPASGGSTTTTVIPNQNGRQITYVLPDNLQPAGTARTIIVSVVDTSLNPICISSGGAALPPPSPTSCPTSISVELRSMSGQLIAPTPAGSTIYANLASGTYTLTVTSPVAGDVTYDFFGAGSSALASGPANSYQVTIGAGNSPREIDIFVRTGECCPVLRATVTLSVGDGGNPGGGTPPDDNPPPPPTTEQPPTGFNICGLFRIMLALSLTALLTALLFIICVSVVTPVAVTVATVAAVSAGLFLALSLTVCRMSLCGFLGVLLWALRWAVAVGVIVAVLLFFLLPLFLPVLMCVLLWALAYGIVAGILTIAMERMGCAIPNSFAWP